MKIDEDGLFTLPVIQGGKYVVLSKKPDSKLVTTIISQIKISVSKKTLSKGKTMNVKSTFPATILKVGKFTKDTLPAVTEGRITYKSGNTSIAAVSSGGKIKGRKPGKTIIYTTVQLKTGEKKTYKFGITVK